MKLKQVNVRLVFACFVLVAFSLTVAVAAPKKTDRAKSIPKMAPASKANSPREGKRNQRVAMVTASKKNGRPVSLKEQRARDSKVRDKNSDSKDRKERLAERRRQEDRRRAELARESAAQRQKERFAALREKVQSMIAKDDVRGEDPEVRRVALNALGDYAGTVVVMNPQTGRIYSIVNQEWALREGFKPCSTIKLVTALAGLNESVIDPQDTTKISDRNQVSLTRALAYSKNGYFQEVGSQVGFDKMVAYARQLGLGEKTGVNVRNEFSGRLPGTNAKSNILRISSHGDNFEVTALQLATLVSAMGNGGKLVTPFIARTRQEEFSFRTKVRRKVNLDSESWRHLVPGMVGAVNYGSGKKAHDPNQTVAGKTGTCIEHDQGIWVGLFASYAPLVNPKLAVVVITRGPEARGHFPAAVAGRIYRDLNGRFGSESHVQIVKARANFQPEEPADVDEEEDEAIPYEATPKKGKLAKGGAASGSLGRVKPVLMQVPKRSEQTAKPKPQSGSESPVKLEQLTRPRRVFGE